MKTTVITKDKNENLTLRAFKSFGEYKWRILICLIIGIIGIVAFSLMPTYLEKAIDRLDKTIPNPDARYILRMLSVFVALFLINGIFSVISLFLILDYEQDGTFKLGLKVKRKLDVVPTAVLEKYTTGDLTRIVAYNVADMMKNILVTVQQISCALFFCVTTSIAMFAISVPLALVIIASLPLCVITARFVSKYTQKHFIAQNESNGVLSTYIDQRVSLQGFYKTHGLDENTAEFKQKNEAHCRGIKGELLYTEFNKMYITFIRNLMLVLITVLCCILINDKLLAFATLPTFLMFSRGFLDQSVVVTNATTVLQILSARTKRVFEVLDHPEVTERERLKIEKLPGDIKFEKVTLVENGEKIIDNVSFTIPKNASIGIIGPTGGGKHKIVELLAKLAVPTSGKITIGGLDLSEIDSSSYYDCIGIAFEKPFIFKGTVAENLLYGIGRTLPEKVMSTAKTLQCHKFIEQLPQGYETELCDNTALLSASQKQAVNVARTVLEAPELIIMDAALTFADNSIENKTFEEIMKMNKNQTKIFVTHRLGSIQNCDLIFYMEKGKIAEIGSHKQLMDNKKKYYKAFTNVNI